MRIVKYPRFSVLVMLLLSGVLLLWQHFGMNRVIRIDAATTLPMALQDDRSSGGASVARLIRDNDAFALHCLLSSTYEWPYCEMSIRLTDKPEGIDLSRFDSVKLNVEYRSPGARALRFFARSYDPAYGKANDDTTWKANELAFTPAVGGEVKTIPLHSFNVASWWLSEHNIPVEYAGPDLQRVRMIQLSTSGLKEPGEHVIRVRYIEFHGKWVSREQMALLVVALWVALAASVLVNDLRQMQRRLRHSRRREEDLRSLTKALQLENKVIGELARRDPLTGVRNRAGIRDELLREAELSQPERPLAVIFIDLDHFKRINDEYGHDTGDLVLKQFTAEVGTLIRREDYLVRWGGEEFVLFCPNTPLASAIQLAEKIRLHLRDLEWVSDLHVTASFGVTVLAQEPVADSLKRADEALYQAKHEGRDRVIAHRP
ncbi:GGDEF domain-containing protein [Chitiniphilus shinanonensis]|uniref:diguanylate cyclase n=1 Tax=Chitiniphilus shinanonensis TaxID=553088 RepID=A0ABQ6BWM8_9NEIS|nr:diguanylate cyclase [Chitiniphilus shinanonensis]GLS06104.1 GGDEF domain-containing protein [Chitiniphilus shinanonensis]